VTTRPEHPTAHARRRFGTRQIVALTVIALTLIFVLQNRATVQIAFFTLTVTAALWLVLVIMLGIGVLIGVLAARRK
jgi:uncharacterized integral membrane protein